MTSADSEALADLLAATRDAVAIEALWDGDTHGWFVDLYAVVRTEAGYDSQHLRGFRSGGDIRIFNGSVPPWPEAREAAQVGRRLADLLAVPFHFPSPDHPEDDCPHWWDLGSSSPCGRCGIPLLQPEDRPWRGVCYRCHLEIERTAREAQWSAEERSAPRCGICGGPALGEPSAPPRCASCRAVYRSFECLRCGIPVTVHRDHATGDTCSSCATDDRLSSLSPSDLRRLQAAEALGAIHAIIAAREILKCGLVEAQQAIYALRARLSRRPSGGPV